METSLDRRWRSSIRTNLRSQSRYEAIQSGLQCDGTQTGKYPVQGMPVHADQSGVMLNLLQRRTTYVMRWRSAPCRA